MTGAPTDPRALPAGESQGGQGTGGQGGQTGGQLLATELTKKEQELVDELKNRDAEVRDHERAHQRAGGPLTGAASYEYTRGPDGKSYAVNGEVAIDSSPESDPEATIHKMEQVIRAALAPATPSSQDRKVAAQAQQEIAKAEGELRTQRKEEQGLAPSGVAGSGENARATGAYARADSLAGLALGQDGTAAVPLLALSA